MKPTRCCFALFLGQLTILGAAAAPLQSSWQRPMVHSHSTLGDAGLVVNAALIEFVGTKEELRKLKDKLRGKDRSQHADGAAPDSTPPVQPCKPNKDMTVEVLPARPGWQSEVVVRNKSGRPAFAAVKVVQTSQMEGKKEFNVKSVPLPPNGMQMIFYGSAARMESCQFVG